MWFGGMTTVGTGHGDRVMTVSPPTARTRLQAVISGFDGDLLTILVFIFSSENYMGRA